jgi:hypothetical protein
LTGPIIGGGPPSAISSNSTTGTITPPPSLSIEDGIPSGTIASLPSTSRIMLAISLDVNNLNIKGGMRKALEKRQDGTASVPAATTASAVSIVNVASVSLTNTTVATAQNVVSQDNCDDATPFQLSNGMLMATNSDFVVGKLVGSIDATLGSLHNHLDDQVNMTFSVIGGYLHWDTLDVGPAIF